MAFFEQHHRSLIKTISYRILIIVCNGLIILWYTGELQTTLDFIGISSIVSTIIYFFHERVWNHIHWGKTDIKKKQ